MLTSTTAVESTADYAAGTTYALGNRVIYNTKKYESLQNTNVGHTPDTNPTWWLYVGSSNKYALFDGQASSPTTGTSSIVTTLTSGVAFDSLAVINSFCVSVRLVITDSLAGNAVVYDKTIGLSGASITSWYDYFYVSALDVRTQIIFDSLPQSTGYVHTLTFTSATGNSVSIGEVLFGTMSDLGATQYGVTAGIIDYSVKTTDAYGITTFTQRNYSKRIEAKVQLNNTQLNRVQTLMYSLRAKPCVWIAADDPLLQEPLIVYGFYKDFSTDIAYPSYSMCSISIEGLI